MNGALEARLVMALRQAGRLTVGAGLVSDAPEFSPRSGDSNAQPTGGTRQVTYKLVPGEAMWQLKPVYSAQF